MSVLAGTSALLACLILSSVAVVWASGLRYNSSTGLFEQTALIANDGASEDVDVWLDGTKVAYRIPYHARHLLPGQYTVELTKNGFQTWRQSFSLSKGQIGLIKDPTLVASQPLITIDPLALTTSRLDRLDFSLQLSDGELTDNGKLVTRFSQNPLQIHRFNEFYLYQVGNELRLFLPLGTQDYLIYRSNSLDQLPLALYPSTWQVAVADGASVKVINLTVAGSNGP